MSAKIELVPWTEPVGSHSRTPVTVIVLARNEEANIARCLATLGWADQVLVFDSESDDATVQIACSMGADVVTTKWHGYSAQRELALRSDVVRNDWVLFVDADEWVSTDLASAVSEALEYGRSEGYWVYKRLVFEGRWIRHCGWYPSARIVILMRRDRARFDPGQIFSEHAIIEGSIAPLGVDIVDEDQKGLESWLHKHVNYASLEAERRGRASTVSDGVRQSRLRTFIKDYVAPRVPARPVVQFLYMYFVRLGFLDGRQGLSFCIYHAWFQRVVEDLGVNQRPDTSREEEKSRVLFMLGNYPPAFKGGGPVRSIHAIVRAGASVANSFVLCSDRDWGESQRLPVVRNRWTDSFGARVYYASDDRPLGYLRGLLSSRSVRPDVVYLNGVLDPKHAIVPLILGRFGFFPGASIVVCPRGELDEGALGGSKKKRFVLGSLRALGFYRRVTVHATNSLEKDRANKILGSERGFLREPETSLPEVPEEQEPDGEDRLLFYSRIDPKKGLHLVLEALAEVKDEVVLDVIGSAQNKEYLAECKSLADRLTWHRIEFLGPVQPEETRDVLARYTALVLPTAGENFGHVIAESYSTATPIFLPPTTPWTESAERVGCLVTGSSVSDWARALTEFLGLSPQEKRDMRRRVAVEYVAWRHSNEALTTMGALLRAVQEGNDADL